MKKIVLAIGGSSGSIYARLLLERLSQIPEQVADCAIVMSENAQINWNLEQSDIDISSFGHTVYA